MPVASYRKRKKGSKVHLALGPLGHLPALHATPANGQDRAQTDKLAAAVQDATGERVETAEAEAHAMRLIVVKTPEARRGFVLLPRRWGVERSFAWTARFRRLVRDYERLPETFRPASARLRLPHGEKCRPPPRLRSLTASQEFTMIASPMPILPPLTTSA